MGACRPSFAAARGMRVSGCTGFGLFHSASPFIMLNFTAISQQQGVFIWLTSLPTEKTASDLGGRQSRRLADRVCRLRRCAHRSQPCQSTYSGRGYRGVYLDQRRLWRELEPGAFAHYIRDQTKLQYELRTGHVPDDWETRIQNASDNIAKTSPRRCLASI